MDILATQDSGSVSIYYKKIADHFSAIQDFDVRHFFTNMNRRFNILHA